VGGILATLAGVFTTIWTTGTFTWNEFILSAIVALLTAMLGLIQPPSPTAHNKFFSLQKPRSLSKAKWSFYRQKRQGKFNTFRRCRIFSFQFSFRCFRFFIHGMDWRSWRKAPAKCWVL
jgi:hypothetical protein